MSNHVSMTYLTILRVHSLQLVVISGLDMSVGTLKPTRTITLSAVLSVARMLHPNPGPFKVLRSMNRQHLSRTVISYKMAPIFSTRLSFPQSMPSGLEQMTSEPAHSSLGRRVQERH
jgi:hypothetical protein